MAYIRQSIIRGTWQEFIYEGMRRGPGTARRVGPATYIADV